MIILNYCFFGMQQSVSACRVGATESDVGLRSDVICAVLSVMEKQLTHEQQWAVFTCSLKKMVCKEDF